jgi:hypothetical protein
MKPVTFGMKEFGKYAPTLKIRVARTLTLRLKVAILLARLSAKVAGAKAEVEAGSAVMPSDQAVAEQMTRARGWKESDGEQWRMQVDWNMGDLCAVREAETALRRGVNPGLRA